MIQLDMSKKPPKQAPQYEGSRIHALTAFSGGFPHRAVELYNPKVGRKKEVACSYQIQHNGEWVEVCRYDSCHGAFHRHKAYWPKRKGIRNRSKQTEHKFERVPVKDRMAVALDDIKVNAKQWQSKIRREVEHVNAAQEAS